MLPLGISMCLNIVLMNFSLAVSTVTFYQIARILLTPVTALLNFLFYRKSLPRKAVIALIPMCLGVGIISYYEPQPQGSSKVATIGFFAVLLAMVSVVVSAVYTIWVAAYQRKYEVNGFQLLFNQAPLSTVILLYVIPWTDKFPVISEVPGNKWGWILLVRLRSSQACDGEG
jgi:solute carrier family 35 protein E3